MLSSFLKSAKRILIFFIILSVIWFFIRLVGAFIGRDLQESISLLVIFIGPFLFLLTLSVIIIVKKFRREKKRSLENGEPFTARNYIIAGLVIGVLILNPISLGILIIVPGVAFSIVVLILFILSIKKYLKDRNWKFLIITVPLILLVINSSLSIQGPIRGLVTDGQGSPLEGIEIIRDLRGTPFVFNLGGPNTEVLKDNTVITDAAGSYSFGYNFKILPPLVFSIDDMRITISGPGSLFAGRFDDDDYNEKYCGSFIINLEDKKKARSLWSYGRYSLTSKRFDFKNHKVNFIVISNIEKSKEYCSERIKDYIKNH